MIRRNRSLAGRNWAIAASGALLVVALSAAPAHAQTKSTFGQDIALAAGVTKAPEGYEAPPTKYVVANPTDIYGTHFIYGSKTTGALKRGEKVDALAKVQGYDWILVGRGGKGIGYVPISMLSPENAYVP